MQRLKQNNNDQKQKLVYLQGLKTKNKKIQELKAKIDIFAETKNIVKAIEIQK